MEKRERDRERNRRGREKMRGRKRERERKRRERKRKEKEKRRGEWSGVKEAKKRLKRKKKRNGERNWYISIIWRWLINSCALFNTKSYIYHHYHLIMPSARIFLTLSRHPSPSCIASGRSSWLHPVSTELFCM